MIRIDQILIFLNETTVKKDHKANSRLVLNLIIPYLIRRIPVAELKMNIVIVQIVSMILLYRFPRLLIK